jgi:hypothetical protein
MARCTHTHGRTLCFECFRAGIERTRARREAWAQRALPFEAAGPARVATRPLTEEAVTHRRQMLDYLATTARRRA